MNIVTLMDRFSNDDKCREILEELRWPGGVACPRCDSQKISRIKKRDQFDCDSCRYQFSVLSGTIFHDTHLPLRKWFVAVYLMTESKKGISANQMKRMLGVAYKTAWYLCHRIRAAMKDVNPVPLTGTVQVDEAWLGGKRPGIGQGRVDHRTMVLGAVEKGGRVRLKVGKRRDNKSLVSFIRSVVDDDAKEIHTDSFPGYHSIEDENTQHETVNHNDEWVTATGVTTNAIEGVWSLLKRSLVGSYHQLSAKHLPAYLDEFTFRFNNRHNDYLFRDTLMALVDAENLTYAELVNTG